MDRPGLIADVNGDGKADIIEISTLGRADVWLSGGSSILDSTFWASGVSQSVKFGDFNGDGKADLLQLPTTPGGVAQVATSNGRADLGFNAFANWGSGFTALDKVGDFNGDGKDDIIQLFDPNQTAYVWLSNGASFDAYTAWGTGVTSNDKVGDFNGDGKDDIIQLSDGTHQAYVWLSNGTSFDPYTVWGGGVTPSDQIGDFNGDGKSDLIQLSSNGNGYVWQSNGTSFDAYQVWGTGILDSAGDDTFVFTGDYGNDIVTDFQPGGGHDVLQLDASVWAGFADVMAHTTDDGNGNAVIAFGGDSITLEHVLRASLSAGDFLFV